MEQLIKPTKRGDYMIEENFGEAWVTLWAVITGIFYWLFDPTTAWMAVFLAFGVAFITKMMQLTAEAGGFIKMLQTKFSVEKAWKKSWPRLILYMVLMFGTTWSPIVLGEGVGHGIHYFLTGMAFTYEFLNSMQHLSKIPGVPEWIFDVKHLFQERMDDHWK